MNKTKIAYWSSTGIFSIIIFAMGIMYFVNPQVAQTFEHLGFPDYLRIEIGTAKILGSILLLIPFKGRLNEWIYAGFTFNLASASLAHLIVGDPITNILFPLVLLSVMAVSYFTGHKLNRFFDVT